MKLVQIVDSIEYIRTNCYQHQVLAHIERQGWDHSIITVAQLGTARIDQDAIVLSSVKIRNVYKHLDVFAERLHDRKVLVYDQDSWESFTDDASFPDGYTKLRARVPRAEFVTTSAWWVDFVKSRGFTAHLCRLMPLPEYCNDGLPSERREPGLSYRGAFHDYRMNAVEELRSLGLNVRTLRSSSTYQEWLQWLRTQTCFFHKSGLNWHIDNRVLPRYLPCVKEVEVAAQGCFTLSDSVFKSELEKCGMLDNPLIFTYDNVRDCVEIFRSIDAMTTEEKNNRRTDGARRVLSAAGTSDIIKVLLDA